MPATAVDVGDLSPHFSAFEFRSKPSGDSIHVDHLLVDVLELIRARTGRPLTIVSGYRSRADNARVGGARNSQHLYGRAADIPAGRCTYVQAKAAGARGIGIKNGWVIHVDTRIGPPAVWHY